MYRNRDVVAERMIIQDVYGEEQCDVDQPPANWYAVRLEEERRPLDIEL